MPQYEWNIKFKKKGKVLVLTRRSTRHDDQLRDLNQLMTPRNGLHVTYILPGCSHQYVVHEKGRYKTDNPQHMTKLLNALREMDVPLTVPQQGIIEDLQRMHNVTLDTEATVNTDPPRQYIRRIHQESNAMPQEFFNS